MWRGAWVGMDVKKPTEVGYVMVPYVGGWVGGLFYAPFRLGAGSEKYPPSTLSLYLYAPHTLHASDITQSLHLSEQEVVAHRVRFWRRFRRLTLWFLFILCCGGYYPTDSV